MKKNSIKEGGLSLCVCVCVLSWGIRQSGPESPHEQDDILEMI